jgi:hypothetical protein
MARPIRTYQKDVLTLGIIDEPLDRRQKVFEKEVGNRSTRANPSAHLMRSKFERVRVEISKEFRLQELNLGLPRDRREYWPLY